MKRPINVIERNVFIKQWSRVDLKVCLCSPSPYETSVLNLALQIIYNMWNRREDVLCERAFPNVYNGVLSLETKRKLSEFDVLAFSLQYEIDIVNVINMLKRCNIPLLSSKRNKKPLIIAGGPLVMQNPKPFSKLFDALFIGEIEELSDRFIDSLKVCLENKSLDPLSDLPCIYVPELKNGRVKRCYVKDLNRCFYPTVQFYPEGIKVAFGPSFLLEISRGCSYNCRFCLAKSIYRPLRIRTRRRVEEILDEGLESTRLDTVSLISFAAADHPELVDILRSIASRGLKFTLPSIRIDKVPLDVLVLLREVGQRSVTMAPEVGSEKLAEVIGKGIYPNDVVEVAKELFRVGFRKMKLYFMIGIPGEEDDDVAKISNLIEEILNIGFSKISVTINPLIPKTHTPFQWLPFISKREFIRRRKMIIEGIRHKRAVSLSFLSWKEGMIQATIARGDWEIGERLVNATSNGVLEIRRVYKEVLKYLKDNPKPLAGFSLDDLLPWEIVDVGIDRKFLVTEYERSLE